VPTNLSLVLPPDRQSDAKYNKITSTRSAKLAKHQLWNKTIQVVENATGYKCKISPVPFFVPPGISVRSGTSNFAVVTTRLPIWC